MAPSMKWRGMRLMRELRRDYNIPIEQNMDSMYRPIEERPETRKFKPLRIPRGLQAGLPFSSKPKTLQPRGSNEKPSYMERRAVIMDPEEKKIVTLMQQINTIKNEKDRKKKAKLAAKRAEFAKKKEKINEVLMQKDKEARKEFYRKMGQESKKKRSLEITDSAFSSKRFKE
jgi:ribosome biogenesis protein BMS1